MSDNIKRIEAIARVHARYRAETTDTGLSPDVYVDTYWRDSVGYARDIIAAENAVLVMPDDPAPANDAAVTEQARVEAIAPHVARYLHGDRSAWDIARDIIAADPLTAKYAALQAEFLELKKTVAAQAYVVASEASQSLQMQEALEAKNAQIAALQAECARLREPDDAQIERMHETFTAALNSGLMPWSAFMEAYHDGVGQALAAQPVEGEVL